MLTQLSCIGVGHMASAILRSLLKGTLLPQNLTVYDVNPASAAWVEEQGAFRADSVGAAVRASDLILLAVRPNQLPAVLEEAAPYAAGKTFVSIAAGVSSDFIRTRLPDAYIVRVMPNATMMVGRGAVAIAQAPTVPAEAFARASEIFSAGALVEIIPEAAMNAVVSVNGSSPAYFYRMAAVIASFAAKNGIDPETGLRLAAKTMEGAAAVLLSGEQTPEALVRMVATPGGTTEAAMNAMTEKGFDEALLAGLEACAARSAALGR